MKTKHTTTLFKGLGAWALTIALVVGMLPQTVFAAGTDTGKAIQLGAGGISGYSDTNSYDYIYYGNWKAPDTHTTSGPIKWRVLDDQTNTGGEGLFLLSDVLLGAGNLGDLRFEQSYHYVDGTYYKGESHNGNHTNCRIMNAWQGSDAQDWCETFYSDSLTTQEQGAVLATTKSDGTFTSTSNIPFAASDNILNGDKVFFLSAEEAESSAYGFESIDDRKANYGSGVGYWWLRSPEAYWAFYAGYVNLYGNVSKEYVSGTYTWAARPAFNLDLNSVLFTSAATTANGGKANSTVDGNLTEAAAYNGNEWKLTLLDSTNHAGFNVTTTNVSTTTAGGSVSISYEGATVGANEYLSAMITSGAGENETVLYYGRLKQLTIGEASGTQEIAIPALSEGTYTLRVFNEQYNGDYNTDYASDFKNVTLTVSADTQGTPNTPAYDLTVNESKVAFAGHEWWVIGDGTSGVYSQDGHITLLAANLDTEFQNIPFRTRKLSSANGFTEYGALYYANSPDGMTNWTTPNEYAGSTLQQKLEDIAESFPTKEQEVITARNLASGAQAGNNWSNGKSEYLDGIAGQGVSDQKLWAISEAEWNTINNDTVRAYGDSWWLRSPHPYSGLGARLGSFPGQSGQFTGSLNVDHDTDAARPALSLNLESVLFTSAAEGGKSSATAGSSSLTAMKTPSGTVKFTMKDASQTLTVNATTAQSTQTGATLSFTYSNATTGTNQYVSCVLTDNTGAVKYYGKLADSSNAASGDLSIPLTGVENGTYTLQIFSEEANGDMYTDFCSEPVTMTLTVTGGQGTVSDFGGTLLHEHSWSNDWSSDATHHWHNCTEGCSITDNSQKDGYAEHNFDRQVVGDTYLASAATCTQAATYYKSCSCGAKGAETFISGEALGHTWSEWMSNGKNEHTRTCSVCKGTETGNCSGGKATCVDKADCDICHAEYGTVDADNHTNLVKTDAKQATHLAEGNTEYWYCDGCNKYFSDEDGTKEIALADTVLPKLTGHTPDETGWHSDETNHWQTCECGVKLNEAAHDFAWETDKEATATEAGSKHEECTVCGYKKAAMEIPATGTPEEPTDPSKPGDTPPGSPQTGDKDNPDTGKTDSPQTGDKDNPDTGKTDSPQTGYSSNIVLWIALALISGVALAGTCIFGRRKKNSL